MDFLINLINKALDLLLEIKGYAEVKNIMNKKPVHYEGCVIKFKDLYEQWKKLK